MTYDAPKTNRPLICILILFNTSFHKIEAVALVDVAKDLPRGGGLRGKTTLMRYPWDRGEEERRRLFSFIWLYL